MRTDEEQIVWYRHIRDTAEAQLNLIALGWRFQRAFGSESLIDITDEVSDRERLTIETMNRLIAMYEGRRGRRSTF